MFAIKKTSASSMLLNLEGYSEDAEESEENGTNTIFASGATSVTAQ